MRPSRLCVFSNGQDAADGMDWFTHVWKSSACFHCSIKGASLPGASFHYADFFPFFFLTISLRLVPPRVPAALSQVHLRCYGRSTPANPGHDAANFSFFKCSESRGSGGPAEGVVLGVTLDHSLWPPPILKLDAPAPLHPAFLGLAPPSSWPWVLLLLPQIPDNFPGLPT